MSKLSIVSIVLSCLLAAVLAFVGSADAQVISYSTPEGETVVEACKAPMFDTRTIPLEPLTISPLGSGRTLQDIPTFCLAKWHHWLSDILLKRAQVAYSDCVGDIKSSQRRLGMFPLIDEEGSPLKATVESVRDYEVPFEPIQFNPDANAGDPIQTLEGAKLPTRKDAISHFEAGLFGYNGTLAHLAGCRAAAEFLRGLR